MPRTHRGLRQSFVYRLEVKGDVPVHSKHEEVYDQKHTARDILPYAPYVRSQTREHFEPGRRHDNHEPRHEPRRPASDDEVITRRKPEKKRISWDTSGDSVRLYTPPSPERAKSADDARKPSKKPKTKKKKPKIDDEKRRQAEEEERRRRLRLEEEERRRRLEKERQAVEEERRRRAEMERRAINEQKQAPIHKSRAPAKKVAAPRRSRSEEGRKPKPVTRQRARSSSRTAGSSRRGATRSIQKPKWSYVGDPTRKAYVTREAPTYLSDFHF